MVHFEGHLSQKQSNPMRPIQRDYKLQCRADMSGHIYPFDAYHGKEINTKRESTKKMFELQGNDIANTDEKSGGQ